jgi:hypothetical protein
MQFSPNYLITMTAHITNRTIRTLPFVTKLTPVDVHKDKEDGWGVCLTYYSCPDSCGKKQEPPVQFSCDRKSELASLQELLKRLQDRHVQCAEAVAKQGAADAGSAAAVSLDAPNVLQAMMKLEQAKLAQKPPTSLPWRRRRKRMVLNKQWKN